MGLDMYLWKETYIGGEYCDGYIHCAKDGKEVPIDFKRLSYIIEEGMYWRKVNSIHKWFVDNVQNGVDDCERYYVSTEDLKDLLLVCKEVLADHSKAEELLPNTRGFFFGSLEYDEYYFEDIKATVEGIERCLKEYDEADKGLKPSFYYESSW